MPGIFISYRRSDSDVAAGRLADDLSEIFGRDAIFRDVDTLEAGEDYANSLDRALDSCAALLVVIGPRWLAADDQGHRRLDDPKDWVRLEISRALKRGIRVIPVLVSATMPQETELPAELEALHRRQAFELSDRHWRRDVEFLAQALKRIPGIAEPVPNPAAQVEKQTGDPVPARRWTIRKILLASAVAATIAVALMIAILAQRLLKPTYVGANAFVSSSSMDDSLTRRLKGDLATHKLLFVTDEAALRTGEPLAAPILDALQKSRYVIVLWSKPASESLFVRAEMLAAYRLKKLVVPCLLDNTDLPAFLRGLPQCDLRRNNDPDVYHQGVARLLEALERAGPIPPVSSAPAASPEKSQAIGAIGRAQEGILSLMNTATLKEARQGQSELDPLMEAARKKWADDPVILSAAGYHKKNSYLLKHWNEIQGGMAPNDDLLQTASLLFCDSLDLQPDDPEALNGLGSVLILRRDLSAAEFFVRSAIDRMKADNQTYPAAEEDLKLILRLKGAREKAWRR